MSKVASLQMVKITEQTISQDPAEPPRRFFSDSRHYEFLIWYSDSTFKKVVGFQIGYKPSSFNTSEEYFLTLKPGAEKMKYGQITGEGQGVVASKIIEYLDQLPPPDLIQKIIYASIELPEAVQDALEKHF